MSLGGEDAEEADAGQDAEQGRDCLSVEELRDALGSLTSLELKRLNRATEMLTRDIAMTPDELVGEAIHAALSGRRRCPREVSVGTFLRNAVRSLASAAFKAEARSKVIPFPGASQEKPNPIEYAPDGSPNPEQILLQRGEAGESEDAAKVAAKELNDHFSDDYDVQLCIAGMMEGLAGQELREFVGVDQAGLDYARKKIRRASRKLFPNGWRNVKH